MRTPVVTFLAFGLAAVVACSSPGGSGPVVQNGIPDLEPPPADPSDLVRDAEVGLQRSLTRVLVMLAEDADRAVTSAATDAAASLGASVVGGLPEVGLMLFALPAGAAPEAVPALRAALLAVPGVEVASEDWAMQTDAVTEVEAGKALPSNDTNGASIPWVWEREPAGANAWLEQVRAPQAWNWNDAIARAGTTTSVGLLDGGLAWSGHEELAPVVTTTPLPGDVNVGHSTNCAGVLAAVASDNAGMTGMTPFARITSIGLGSSSAGIASIGDVLLRGFRQLVRHTPVRVVSMSLGYNWRNNQLNPAADTDAQGATPNYDPPSERPAQQRVVREGGLIGARMAKHLAHLAAPVMIVVSAGNDGLDPAKVSPAATPEQQAHAASWARPDARWNSPFCWAAIEAQAPNVLCIEAVKTTANGVAPPRAAFSDVGGQLSAPGVAVTTTDLCTTSGCSRTSLGYASPSGTSFSTPMVAGLVAHMLAFAPDADLATVRQAIFDTVRSAESGTAPQIDAGQAMRRLPGAWEALLDVDDGTVDGLDMTRFDDDRGDGDVDMSDFRRVRDTILWDAGQRDGLIAGEASTSTKKRDHNRDGVVSDTVPEVWSRFDFDDDGVVAVGDLKQLGATPAWNDPRVPGTALEGLAQSADLLLDLDDFWRKGAKRVRVQADTAPYAFEVAPTDPWPFVYTVGAGVVSLTVTIVEGPAIEARPKTVTVVAGEDLAVKLRRKRTAGPPCPVTQSGGGSAVSCELGDDFYVVDPDSFAGCYEAAYCDGAFYREAVWWEASGQITARPGLVLPEPLPVGAMSGFGSTTCGDAVVYMQRACREGVCADGTSEPYECTACDGLRMDGPATVVWPSLSGDPAPTCNPPGPEEYSRGSISFTLVSCEASGNTLPGCE